MTKHEDFKFADDYYGDIKTMVISARLEKIYGVRFGLVNNVIYIVNEDHLNLSFHRSTMYLPFIIGDTFISAQRL